MSAESDAREWHYCDVMGGAQKGPVPAIVLCRLLEKGVGVSPQTLIWKAGMESWLPMSAVEPFKGIAEFNAMQWYYIDIEGQQHGPVLSKMLVHKLKEGDIDGLSLVYGGDSTTEWRKVSEVQVLKNELAKIATEEENMRLAFLKAEDASDTQNQVFVQEFDPAKAFPIPKEMLARSAATAAASAASAASAEGATADQKIYVADNGQRYVWDDEEEDWVEEDPSSTTSAATDDKKHAGASDAAKDTKKRKLQANKNPDDDSDEEDADEKAESNLDSTKTDPNSTSTSNSDNNNKPKKKRSKKKPKKGPNTWVYITGLPQDVTLQELKDHFSKVGLIALSPYDQQAKIKIYRDASLATPSNTSSGSTEAPCKGDALLCYNAEESVKLAVDVLSGGFLRPTHQVTVTRADFSSAEHGADGDNSVSTHSSSAQGANRAYKPVLSQAQVKVAKSAIKQALTWNEDDDIGVSKSAALRIIVLENLFKPTDFADPAFSDELEGDLAEECEKFGTIEKITFFSTNPRGIAVVKFATSYAAQECIRVMNGRFFGGQKLKSYFWDGVANYSVTVQSEAAEEEAERQEESRLDEFGDWLENNDEELPEELRLRTE